MNKRQIPFLHWSPRGHGYVADWKPSPRLRKLGWTNRRLGLAPDKTGAEAQAIVQAAMALNQQLDAWQAAGAATAPEAPRKVWTVSDLADAYRASTDWTELAPKTQAEYRTRLSQLEIWARDATGRSIPFRQLDQAMVIDLKDALLPVSRFKAAATLRVLRILLRWGSRHGAHDATHGVKIPSTPPRAMIVLPQEVEAGAAAAETLGFPAIALALRLDLWLLQRAADVRALTRVAWREIVNVDPADRPVLVGPAGSPTHGKVMGFRLQQAKTGAWVDCPVPPAFHAAIEAAFQRSQYLVPDDADPSRACPQHLFQRRVRKAFALAGLPQVQFRDLRRSGMCMMRDLGVHDATPISGHMILGKRSILDTYMPGNTRAACSAMAHALRMSAQRDQLKDQADGA